ncbi:aquaporin family protein [Serinibacter arcticus]|uniref:Aquaporin family protein n=1 Tax=Serinibacter arcticus TaxID=1655435 RepID=A0A2U1ZY28_9MICO|nr:MIP/aquaporin family protein [Serinibacter arcticus]PWD51881.1 aquaporin family protein [Serinibacter arcticus]
MSNIFVPELIGTALLILLGGGVVANVILKGTKGFGGGWLLINFGWGLAVFTGVYAAFRSGAHLNPAVTVGLWTSGGDFFAGNADLGLDPIAANAGNALIYIAAQLVGAIIGAFLVWVIYKDHFDAEEDPGAKLGVFATGPAIRSLGRNFVTEVIATFVLVFTIIHFGPTPTAIGPLAVALVVVGIGASLGGPTGYAINPARDLGPRIVHALLPIKGKGSSDWGYSWVPIAGPLVGGALAGLVGGALTVI